MELAGIRRKLKTGIPTDGLFIFVGQPKSGKTTLAASWPDSYLLELEPGGADRVEGRIHDIKNLAEFREVLKLVIENKDIKTVVVDTIDVLSDLIEADVAQNNGVESMSDKKPGVDGFAMWAEYRKRIDNLVGYFKASGKLVILLAHTKEAKIDINGSLITPMGINLPGKSGSYVAGQADAIGYCYKKQISGSSQYFISFQGGPLGTWGSRVAELEDKIVQLPKTNQYSAISALFDSQEVQTNGLKPTKRIKALVAA